MRQRLLSEPDRYRGRRRVPTPPRSRYALVVTTAVVGAGVVALGAGAALPDAKTVSPSALAELENASATGVDAAARADAADRASRDDARADSGAPIAETPDVWVLPLKEYEFITPYGVHWGKMHAGIDLAAAEGTPYLAIHSGTVKLARWHGGFGYTVIVEHEDGTESIYGHSAKLMVEEGQQVKAGEVLGLVGNTGHSYGSRLHLELIVNGQPTDPIPWLLDKGVDIKLKLDSIYAEASAS